MLLLCIPRYLVFQPSHPIAQTKNWIEFSELSINNGQGIKIDSLNTSCPIYKVEQEHNNVRFTRQILIMYPGRETNVSRGLRGDWQHFINRAIRGNELTKNSAKPSRTQHHYFVKLSWLPQLVIIKATCDPLICYQFVLQILWLVRTIFMRLCRREQTTCRVY